MTMPTMAELVVLGLVALAGTIVLSAYACRYAHKDSMPLESENVERASDAFWAWMEANGGFEELLKRYGMKRSATGIDGWGTELAVLDYLSFGMSPTVRKYNWLQMFVFTGNLPALDLLEESSRVIEEVYDEVEDLLMMWRSDHIIALSEGEVALDIVRDGKVRSISNASARRKAEERGLVDMLHCYYDDGLPAADLAA